MRLVLRTSLQPGCRLGPEASRRCLMRGSGAEASRVFPEFFDRLPGSTAEAVQNPTGSARPLQGGLEPRAEAFVASACSGDAFLRWEGCWRRVDSACSGLEFAESLESGEPPLLAGSWLETFRTSMRVGAHRHPCRRLRNRLGSGSRQTRLKSSPYGHCSNSSQALRPLPQLPTSIVWSHGQSRKAPCGFARRRGGNQ